MIQDSTVNQVTGHGLDNWASVPSRCKDFLLHLNLDWTLRSHPDCAVGTGGSLPRDIVAGV
jgi:hypothetical protein